MSKDRPNKTATFSLRLDPQLKADLEELAKSADRSLANYLDQVLRPHVEAEKRKKRPRK